MSGASGSPIYDSHGISVGTIVRTTPNQRYYTKGTVTRIYRNTPKGPWRIDVIPENKVEWFIRTGHDNWAYAYQCKAMPRLTAHKDK